MQGTAVQFGPSTGATALQQALGALQTLIGQKPDADQLVSEMVRLAGGALSAGGAGMWVTELADQPELILEHQLGALGLMQENKPLQGLNAAVRRCAREGKPLIVPSFFVDNENNDLPVNPTAYELLFIPVRLHAKVAMVLAMAVPPTGDASLHRVQIQFLQKMTGAVETSLAERHLHLMEKDRGTSSRIVAFAEQVHKHLRLSQVAVDIANLVRDVVGADRVTVELYPRLRRKAVAVSNVDEPNQRGALFQAQRLVFDYMRDRNVPAVLDREASKSLVADPLLQDAALAYFTTANFGAFGAVPIREGDAVIGVVLAEFASAERARQSHELIYDLARISASSVTNAIEYESIPLRRALSAVSQLWRRPTSTRRKMIWSGIGAAVLAGIILGVIPFDFAIKADCTVQPREQLMIVAPDDGRVIDVPVHAGERVHPQKAGEARPLVRFDTTELEAALGEQQQKEAEARVKLKDVQAKGDISQIGAVQLQVKQVEDQIKLIRHRMEMATVYSPIEGTVLTENVEQKKYASLKMGEPIMEVASFEDWVLVIDIPESEVAMVRGALDHAARRAAAGGGEDQGVEVEYIFYPWPDQRQEVRAKGIGTLLPASSVTNNKNVFRMYVKLDRKNVPAGIALSGVTGRAKIHVGKKALFTQWTRGLNRLLHMTLF